MNMEFRESRIHHSFWVPHTIPCKKIHSYTLGTSFPNQSLGEQIRLNVGDTILGCWQAKLCIGLGHRDTPLRSA